jgi:hypothetical protein
MRVYQFRHVGTDVACCYYCATVRVGINAHPTYNELLRINSGRVVPTEGLEPPHLAAHGPEPCASTNSATWALNNTGVATETEIIAEGLQKSKSGSDFPSTVC